MVLLILLASINGFTLQAPATAECSDSRTCRQLALEAADRQDYERFHDLAWRAVQKGQKNETDLMYLLARAQALSGRPGDALVMLSRLVEMTIPTDAVTNDDFRRVRALKGWPDLLARIEALNAPPGPASAEPKPDAKVDAAKGDATKAGAPPTRSASPPTPNVPFEEALRFSAAGLVPGGLAYDAVSRRFLVADHRGRKLAVVDEFSSHVATLAGAQAGFGDLAGLEIDPREGNLWVVSDAGDSDTRLHKLQLISGRVLTTYQLAPEFLPAHFVDVAVGQDGAVLVLDAARGRLFRLAAGGAALEPAAELAYAGVSSVAPAQPGVAYVAHASSIARVDLRSRIVSAVKMPDGVDLSGIARLRWGRTDLVAIQKAGDQYRVIRLTLDAAGRRITGLDVLDPGFATSNPASATVVGGTLYYMVDADGPEVTVRKIKLR